MTKWLSFTAIIIFVLLICIFLAFDKFEKMIAKYQISKKEEWLPYPELQAELLLKNFSRGQLCTLTDKQRGFRILIKPMGDINFRSF